MHSVKQLVPSNGRFVTVTRTSEHPYMVDLDGTLLSVAYGGRSGRKAFKAGTPVTVCQLPNNTWLVKESPFHLYGMCRKNGDSLEVNVDFTIVLDKQAERE
jgi:hypothetical protein